MSRVFFAEKTRRAVRRYISWSERRACRGGRRPHSLSDALFMRLSARARAPDRGVKGHRRHCVHHVTDRRDDTIRFGRPGRPTTFTYTRQSSTRQRGPDTSYPGRRTFTFQGRLHSASRPSNRSSSISDAIFLMLRPIVLVFYWPSTETISQRAEIPARAILLATIALFLL